MPRLANCSLSLCVTIALAFLSLETKIQKNQLSLHLPHPFSRYIVWFTCAAPYYFLGVPLRVGLSAASPRCAPGFPLLSLTRFLHFKHDRFIKPVMFKLSIILPKSFAR